MQNPPIEGYFLIDKPSGKSSFFLVMRARKWTGVRKIGHTGTLDPLASGLMVLLVGKSYTKKAPLFVNDDKEYVATFALGHQTTTDDSTGEILASSPFIPTLEEIEEKLNAFQGDTLQIPPTFCAKKKDGVPLYKRARQGKGIQVEACPVSMKITLISYNYPHLTLKVHCSKGCYIRSLGRDLGIALGSFATLTELRRTRVGLFSLENALPLETLETMPDRLQFLHTEVLCQN